VSNVPSHLLFILQHYWRLYDPRLSDVDKWRVVTNGLVSFAEFIRVDGESSELCESSSTPEDEPLPQALKYLASRLGSEVLKDVKKYSCNEIADAIVRAIEMMERGEIIADFDEALLALTRFTTMLATLLMRRYQIDSKLLASAQLWADIEKKGW